MDELGAAGLVERARDTADRRRVMVTVTSEGRALLEALKADARSVQEEVLAPLTARERARLTALLRRVHDGMRGSEGARPGR
ncbi:hypothetical protein [Streptomyces sp. A1277]|uniref:hypothetical protein n=1 Tax=Streptomyces sp. A1277 TaxID=2563103 RepID=UPI001F11647B|nr:hypothetical protein [Streptomyces sp. A1277]